MSNREKPQVMEEEDNTYEYASESDDNQAVAPPAPQKPDRNIALNPRVKINLHTVTT